MFAVRPGGTTDGTCARAEQGSRWHGEGSGELELELAATNASTAVEAVKFSLFVYATAASVQDGIVLSDGMRSGKGTRCNGYG